MRQSEWQQIAEQQERVIEELCSLCKEIMAQLSQYKSIEEEEKRLQKLEGDK